jgi:hypothetical protein
MQSGNTRVNADPEVSVIVNDKKSLQPQDNKDYVAPPPAKKSLRGDCAKACRSKINK